jgi:hypothetical protein
MERVAMAIWYGVRLVPNDSAIVILGSEPVRDGLQLYVPVVRTSGN